MISTACARDFCRRLGYHAVYPTSLLERHYGWLNTGSRDAHFANALFEPDAGRTRSADHGTGRPAERRDVSLAHPDRRVRSTARVGGWEPALLRALVELQSGSEHRSGAREGARGACARRGAEDRGGHALQETHAAQGIHIDSDTAATRWRGERMDYELGVWVLCSQEERARNARDVSAETSQRGDI